LFYTHSQKDSIDIIVKFPYKIGIVTFMVFPELLKSDEGAADKIRLLAKDPFFDLLEVAPMSNAEWIKLQDYLKGLNRKIDFALGLQPEILVRKYNPSAVNEDERKKAEEVLVKWVDIACARDMCGVALCSGPVVPETQRGKAVESFIKTVSAMAEKASKCNIPIYIETFDVIWDKKRLLGNLEFAAKVIDEIKSSYPNVYLLWDLSHGPLLGEKPEDLKSYARYLGHIHIGCSKKVGEKLYDWHPGFYRPGAINDEHDVARLLRVLLDIGYRGAVSFEVKPEEGQLPMEVVYTAKSVLERAFQIVLEEW